MIERRKTISAAIVTVVVIGLVHADAAAGRLGAWASAQDAAGHSLAADLAGLDVSSPSACDLAGMILSGRSLGIVGDIASPAEPRPVVILNDRQSSLTLCLYALAGLGLCKSAPWVQRFSLVVVPQWYHDGGPWQIGHSFAISPQCLCPVAVSCFVQPQVPAEDLSRQYASGTVLPLWRDSQFIHALLVGRGPPVTC